MPHSEIRKWTRCCTGWFYICMFNSVCCPVLQAEPRNMNGLVKADTPPFCKQVAWNWCDLPSSIVIFKWNCFAFSWKGMCTSTYLRVCSCDSRKADSRPGKNARNPSSTSSRAVSQKGKKNKQTTWARTEILSYVGWVLLGCARVTFWSRPDSLNWFIINSPQLNVFFLKGFGEKNVKIKMRILRLFV